MTFGLGAKLFGIAALVIAVIEVVPVKVTGAMFAPIQSRLRTGVWP